MRIADQKSRVLIKEATSKGVSDGTKNNMVFKKGKSKGKKGSDDEDEDVDEGEGK